jgi:S1-C subfamily serine protease
VEHPFLGINASELTPSIANLFHLPVQHGLLIDRVEPGSAAAAAGLRGHTTQVVVAGVTWPIGGDIIVEVDGVSTTTVEKLRDVIASHKPGDTIRLVVYRGGTTKFVDVKLGRQPSS